MKNDAQMKNDIWFGLSYEINPKGFSSLKQVYQKLTRFLFQVKALINFPLLSLPRFHEISFFQMSIVAEPEILKFGIPLSKSFYFDNFTKIKNYSSADKTFVNIVTSMHIA